MDIIDLLELFEGLWGFLSVDVVNNYGLILVDFFCKLNTLIYFAMGLQNLKDCLNILDTNMVLHIKQELMEFLEFILVISN